MTSCQSLSEIFFEYNTLLPTAICTANDFSLSLSILMYIFALWHLPQHPFWQPVVDCLFFFFKCPFCISNIQNQEVCQF